jgi:hypothetical protein
VLHFWTAHRYTFRPPFTEVGFVSYCVNRYNHPLAGKITYRFVDEFRRITQFGSVTLLPDLKLLEDETIQLVLVACGVRSKLQEPEWVHQIEVPGQLKIEEEIKSIETEMEQVRVKHQSAKRERLKLRDCLKLLYERETALEPIVWNVLRDFGAVVEEPKERNKEDGWVKVNVGELLFEGVLEIKSTKSDVFGEDGRKQLLDWIDRGRVQREKNYKGIFIGNNAVDKPVANRPSGFSDSWIKAAKLSSICAIRTEDLYQIYLLKCKGVIDLNEFWLDLFNTNGLFDMQKYNKRLDPASEPKVNGS